MRVLFVHETAGFYGGAERWIFQVARGLSRRYGFKCHLAYTEATGREAEQFAAAFAALHHVDRPWAWPKLVGDVQPDLICVNNLAMEPLEALANLKAPSVRIVHDHALSCLSGKRLYTWSGRVCERKLGLGCWACLGFVGRHDGRWHLNRLAETRRALEQTRRLSGVVVLSRYMRSELIRAGVPAEHIHVVPPGVEGARGRGGTLNSQLSTLNYGTGVRLLFAGQVIRGKGLDLLLRAMPSLPGDCTLTVAGTGNALETNRALARRLGLSERVNFLGWQAPEQLDRCYRDADVVVVPSRWPEPFGLVGIEAMSHARPVVAFDVGAVRDWLVDGTTGLVVPQADVRLLAAALDSLIADPRLRRQMGEAGHAAYCERFTTELMLDRLAECFEQIVAQDASPSLCCHDPSNTSVSV